MEVLKKLKILGAAARYDVACTSSGTKRKGSAGTIGSTQAMGICHSFAADGRCISLLKILQTNVCIYDCKYCHNRSSNDVARAAFTPEEVAELTMNFYRRNYIEGLFLSSAIIKNPDYTMEMLLKTLTLVRNKYKFNGYIHVKGIPGADDKLIYATGLLADRMSINIELPSQDSLKQLAPDKTKHDILQPMKWVKNNIQQSENELAIYRHAQKFVPAGQSTQLIVGATPENDRKVIALSEGLYHKYDLKRVFYSAYIPTGSNILPQTKPPLLREHRLYQADWLLRFYKFKASEILDEQQENLSLNLDPKCQWAIRNTHLFPMEINSVDFESLLRIPGIGWVSAERIIAARRVGKLDFYNLKKLGVVLKRAKYFITCKGKRYANLSLEPEFLSFKLSENKINENNEQISLLEKTEGGLIVN